MNARELERLLGGYAAGTLTDSEHSALMRAALDDQQLFDALADEEALRDALADPVFRARLRARLAPEAQPERGMRWLWWLAPALAAGLALFFVINRPDQPKSMEIAATKSPAQETAAPVASPAAPPTPVAAAAPQARKTAPETSVRADREVSTRANEAAPKELREEPPPPAAAPPPPPPPPKPALQAAPVAVAESVSLSAPAASTEKKSVKDERAKISADAEAPARLAAGGARPAVPPAAGPNPALAVELDLQIERAVNGRFESAELGALRQGDRVRFRIRAPEDGRLTFTAASRTNTLNAQRGQTYYLPSAEGLPPGDAPLEVVIALQPGATVETANLFRSRQQASNAPAGSSVGAMRDTAKEQDALTTQKAVAAPRTLRLRLEFTPR